MKFEKSIMKHLVSTRKAYDIRTHIRARKNSFINNGGEYKNKRLMTPLSPSPTTTKIVHAGTCLRASPPKQRYEGGEQETRRFPRSRLGARHKITVGNPNRNGVFLHGGWLRVATQLGRVHELFPEHLWLEAVDRLRYVLARGFHRDIIILMR